MGTNGNGHHSGSGIARRARDPVKPNDSIQAIAIAEELPLAAATEHLSRLSIAQVKDLQRLEALKQRILTAPSDGLADQIWFALARSQRINPNDPWVRRECRGRRPSDTKLLRFFVSVLRRVAPELLIAVRANAAAIAGTMANEAIETIHRHATRSIGNHSAPGAAVNLRAAAMILKIAGIDPDGAGGATVSVQMNQQNNGAAPGPAGITETALRQVESARQSLYDAAIAGGGGADDGDGAGYSAE